MLEEDISEKSQSKEFEDIFSKFPTLARALNPVEQQKLLSFLREKSVEIVIRYSWKKSGTEREKAARGRQQLLQEEVEKGRAIKDKDKQIAILEEKLVKENEEKDSIIEDTKQLRRTLQSKTSKYSEDMGKMIRSNDASENANRMANQRIAFFDAQIKVITIIKLLY